jgi:hypothetical protein
MAGTLIHRKKFKPIRGTVSTGRTRIDKEKEKE